MKHHPQSLLLAAICLGLAACATHRQPDISAPIQAPAPAPKVIGTVSLVNEELGFALIQTAETPEAGTPLQARATNGQETAALKVSKEQKHPFVIADVMNGKPHVGEIVTK
ncbi:MAG: hypothetical protein NTZ46_01940 [Verrucomicrobia bacterium]|nr:hypothetical protein [Verrucomicrobiota bacterium]